MPNNGYYDMIDKKEKKIDEVVDRVNKCSHFMLMVLFLIRISFFYSETGFNTRLGRHVDPNSKNGYKRSRNGNHSSTDNTQLKM